jgi:hypothetical protein
MISATSTNVPLGTYIAMSSYPENGFQGSDTSVTFTAAEMAAGTLSKDIYVYVLGASDETYGHGQGIVFDVENVSIYNNENVPAYLYIKKATPQILYPTENYSYTGVPGGVLFPFKIRISDDYKNMQSTFIVEWDKTGSGATQQVKVDPPFTDGEANVGIRYNAGNYTSRFRVQNASGVWSDYRTVTVQVNPAKQVSVIIEEPNDSGEYNETDEELTFHFKLTEAFEESKLYAFLVPKDVASSNLVVCKYFNTGVEIKPGDTESRSVKIQLLDGTDDSLPLSYSIVLRTEKTLDLGEPINTYESKDLDIYINNVTPYVTQVNMQGSQAVTVNGGKFRASASVGIKKIFSLDAFDVEPDLATNLTSLWTCIDPHGNAVEHKVTGALESIEVTNVFQVVGTNTCTVKLQDKDMGKKKWGEAFTFDIEVVSAPSVVIDFPNSDTYHEQDLRNAKFLVKLSTPSTKDIDVALECKKIGSDGILTLSTNSVPFPVGRRRWMLQSMISMVHRVPRISGVDSM